MEALDMGDSRVGGLQRSGVPVSHETTRTHASVTSPRCTAAPASVASDGWSGRRSPLARWSDGHHGFRSGLKYGVTLATGNVTRYDGRLCPEDHRAPAVPRPVRVSALR